MDHAIQERVRDCFSLLNDPPSQLIYSGQVYYNITGDYTYIAKMLRTLFLQHRSCIRSDKLTDAFTHCLDDLDQLRPLKRFVVDHDYMFFDPSVVRLGEEEVFIDCGAMDMSTSLEFAYRTKDSYKRIVALEPDPICQEICQDNLVFFSRKKRDCVCLLDCGAADVDGTLPFRRSVEPGGSCIVERSEENIPVKKIDDIPECADATFIKIHIEGRELEALKGARETIARERPTVAVSCYHNLEELLTVPFLLKQLCPDYRLYMRHYSTGTSESVLYAVPPERDATDSLDA